MILGGLFLARILVWADAWNSLGCPPGAIRPFQAPTCMGVGGSRPRAGNPHQRDPPPQIPRPQASQIPGLVAIRDELAIPRNGTKRQRTIESHSCNTVAKMQLSPALQKNVTRMSQ